MLHCKVIFVWPCRFATDLYNSLLEIEGAPLACDNAMNRNIGVELHGSTYSTTWSYIQFYMEGEKKHCLRVLAGR